LLASLENCRSAEGTGAGRREGSRIGSCARSLRRCRSSSTPLNERFGTAFNQADQFFFDQIVEAAVGDDELRQPAAVNPEDKFDLVFRNLLERLSVERMDQNEEIFVRYINDAPFRDIMSGVDGVGDLSAVAHQYEPLRHWRRRS
jgi:hypothetical protein